MQTFFTRRIETFMDNPITIAAASATLFSLIHFPNPVLMVLTWVGGFYWTYSFLNSPNLYALALSHGWLAVMLRFEISSSSPKTWWVSGMGI